LIYYIDNKETELAVTNKYNGLEVKKLYCDKEKIISEKFKIRLLYKGQEIKDEQYLFYFTLENNSRLQISLCPLD
jgi:hypothetical protein